MLLDYKFNEKPYIYETFVTFIKNNSKACRKIKKYDIIIPVPISKKRKKQRGYNQSSLFARELAKELQIKYLENMLIKTKNNVPQSTLDQANRGENVKGVYELSKMNVKNDFIAQNILIIDDIFTTGSTLNECSKILKNIGTKNIGVLTIAKD